MVVLSYQLISRVYFCLLLILPHSILILFYCIYAVLRTPCMLLYHILWTPPPNTWLENAKGLNGVRILFKQEDFPFYFILSWLKHEHTRGAKENVFPDDGGDYKSCAKAHHFNYSDRQRTWNFLDSSSARAAISKATKHVENKWKFFLFMSKSFFPFTHKENNKWQKIKEIVYFSLNYFDVACNFNDVKEAPWRAMIFSEWGVFSVENAFL